MRKAIILSVVVMLGVGVLPGVAPGATEQAKRAAINQALAWLDGAKTTASGTEVFWDYGDNRYDLAATAAAALAFIEEGHYPGSGTAYETTATKAITWLFNRANANSLSWETLGYNHHAEDYNGDGTLNDGGNGKGLSFSTPGNPSASQDIYSNGIVAPVLHALGQKLGQNTTIGMGSADISGLTYKQASQDLGDWFAWAQVEPNEGVHRGGWRYYPNYSSSDNSTAQWGALALLYAEKVAPHVKTELEKWCTYIQNANGGSGYDHPSNMVSESKTGGLMLELALLGKGLGDPAVNLAQAYINARWNNGASGTWYGNIGHPYAMWAIYKALQVEGLMAVNDNGTPGDPSDDFLVGFGMSNAPGGFTIGQDWAPQTSLAGDWYSHYSDWLVSNQNANGSWNGYSYWTGPLATAWYVNILNATGAPPPIIPEPITMVGAALGLLAVVQYVRRRRH